MFNKNTKISQSKLMFFTLKVLSLFFSAIPFFQYFHEYFKQSTSNDSYGSLISMILGLVMIFIIMLIWISLSNKRIKRTLFMVIETIIFFAVFVAAIYLSGADKSYYKFLFLFSIISCTIEHGMKPGLIIAAISSVIILAIDIIFGGFSSLNEYFQNDLALSALFLIVAWTLGFYVKLENSHIEKLTQDANLDGLTGLHNHRFFHQYLKMLFDKSLEEKRDLSLLIFDIHYFKKYNELCGHQKGDELLKEISDLIKGHLRAHDLLCRYGGDEFCLILPDTGKSKAGEIAQRIGEIVSKHKLDDEKYIPNASLTISIGVSSLDSETTSYLTLIDNADTALYRAKFLRRNRVEVYSSVFDILGTAEDGRSLEESLASAKSLIAMINTRDNYSAKHAERVVEYCRIMADYLGMNKDNRKRLMLSAYLHDIGKVNLPKGLLSSDRTFTDEDWSEMKRYPEYGAKIISQMTGFGQAIQVVLQHREDFDGSGYPAGLSGDNSIYLARILNIVESFDAMTNLRSHRKTKTFEEAFEELEKCRHSQFDPILTDLFIEMLKSQ